MTEATILIESSTWRVGRWRCHLEAEQQGPDLVARTVWRPAHPEALDHLQVSQLRVGRAIAKSQIEEALGREVVLK